MQQGDTTRPTRRHVLAGTAAAAAAALVRSRGAGAAEPLGANDRINIGFIGCGGRANDHLHGMAALRDAGEPIRLAAACDVYAPRLRAKCDKFKLRPYRTYQELLQDKEIDAVFISTPDHHHGIQAIDAIAAGKDVYCEKPVTHWRQFEVTKKLAKTVAGADRIFMLGSQYMSDGAWPIGRRLIEEGAIGKLIHAECAYYRLGDWGERGMPIDDPNAKPGPDLNWEAFLGDAPKRPFDVSRFFRWRMYRDYSGGPSTDLYPHFLTQVIYMLGVGFPSTVVATGGKLRFEEREVPDTFSFLAEYPEKLTLVMTGTQGSNYPGRTNYGVATSPVIRGWDASLTFEGTDAIVIPGDQKAPPKRVLVDHPWSHERYYRMFVEALRSRKQPLSSAELAYKVQTVLHMAMLSWSEGKVARFDHDAEKIVLS